jgi:alkanesulfonate monooxygenase SsuD/methylene tetrahydromethanopterin reductase-like flavin-dependent oxidoreductase (luciferase family)
VTLHLGITPWHLNPPTAASIGDQAAFAEANGYQSFWLPENHFGDGALPDPLMLLASAATSTSSIQLATTSYLLTLRNPLQAAEQVAVLDQLSGGRVLLGVGRGYAPEMLRAFHVPVAEKRRIFAWTLDLMQKAWSGEAISLDGDPEHAVMVHPRPVQQAAPANLGGGLWA